MKKRSNPEFNKFDTVMEDLLKVPHSEIKAKLEAEKVARKRGKANKNRPKDQASR
jgi:hypothetical protein